jgi:uroporphyrinogen decarboxylase
VLARPPTYDVVHLGCNHEGYGGGGDDSPVGTQWVDIFGTSWQKIYSGVMGFPKGFPLAHPQDLGNYTWPDPDDERICGMINPQAQAFPGGELILAGVHRDLLWEKAYMLVGMENMLVYLYTAPGFARQVLHGIMDFQMGIARHYLRIGARLVYLGDDLGSQSGPLISPHLVREFFLPEYRRIFQLYKQNEVLISFHSCGKIDAFVEMFAELGVDILNPVQASANDLDRLRTLTHRRMTLWGGVNSQTLMEGPFEQIVAEVRHRLWQLGQDGGYLCAPDQSMPYPPEHRRAYEEALESFGVYPLSPL